MSDYIPGISTVNPKTSAGQYDQKSLITVFLQWLTVWTEGHRV